MSLAHRCVAIDAATERFHRIVEVHTSQILESDLALELGKDLVATLLGREIVARSERVAGVETYAHTRFILHTVNDIGQVPECVAEV